MNSGKRGEDRRKREGGDGVEEAIVCTLTYLSHRIWMACLHLIYSTLGCSDFNSFVRLPRIVENFFAHV